MGDCDKGEPMLVIRKEQMAAFQDQSKKKFEDRVIIRINRCFPEDSEKLGEEKVRESIRYGIQEAEKFDIVNEGDVCLYIDLMYVFGKDFATDSALSWVQEILQDSVFKTPSAKMNALYDTALDYQNAGNGIQWEM